MAEFMEDLQSLRPSYPFLDHTDMELANYQLTELCTNISDSSSINMQSSFLPFYGDTFLTHQEPEFAGSLEEKFVGLVNDGNQNTIHISKSIDRSSEISTNDKSKKRKAMDVQETSSGNSTPPPPPHVSEIGINKRGNSSGRGKTVRSNETEEEKPKDVVHVRAKRGQATDSHSLAERVRRGKINEKLRCLQNIVPGCYKTMGMAVMLDEIINYVQSLQNQVEFLSMKLTAASTFYDFNSETDAIEAMQRAKACEAKEVERSVREKHGVVSCFQSTWN